MNLSSKSNGKKAAMSDADFDEAAIQESKIMSSNKGSGLKNWIDLVFEGTWNENCQKLKGYSLMGLKL